MGISFVDILIQSVFLLLVIVMAGYVDPEEKEQLQKISLTKDATEYVKIGRDLCVKVNKDNYEACREYLKDAVIASPTKAPDVGKEVCNKVNAKDNKDCISKLNQLIAAESGSLFPCLPGGTRNYAPPSTIWQIRRPDEIAFVEFSKAYKKYINENSLREKILFVSRIESLKNKIFKPSEIETIFGSIRELSCYHTYSYAVTGKYTSSDISSATNALRKLRDFSSNK